ncbi:SAM-dependent methyltransferase [Rhodococcus sp. 27YEA15]|uniref:methyltransferase n=1 Tax=Rhodococcus sp. 27YEA15 TaxID=3156259 RepID=UPI003C7DF8DF
MTDQFVTWTEDGVERSARWGSTSGAAAPKRVIVADDTTKADDAYRLACEGTALLWRGDFHNGRQLSKAVAARMDRKPRKTSDDPATAFHLHRQTQGRRARILGMLLVPLAADLSITLRRAPEARAALTDAFGIHDMPSVRSLRDVMGAIGAGEWHRTGVRIDALDARIHPVFGVFSPVRGEYVDLVATAPLPSTTSAFDIGTGTGVLAAVLARRGIRSVTATDQDPRALRCAHDNLTALGYADRVKLLQTDLFPTGTAPLVVCNPPWIPAKATSPIEYAVYDPAGAMLEGFLTGVAAHLDHDGEAWLILSDIAEHLGLRTRGQLHAMIAAGGLTVIDRLDVKPDHGKVFDRSDVLHAARARETTSLWRLRRR